MSVYVHIFTFSKYVGLVSSELKIIFITITNASLVYQSNLEIGGRPIPFSLLFRTGTSA